MDAMKQDEVKQANGRKRKVAAAIVFAVVAVIGIISIFFYIEYKNTHISTDDAFVDGNIYTIASKVPGTAKTVYVDDNQFVKKGGLLAEIDPIDYDVKVREAESSLSSEEAKLTEAKTKIDAAEKQLSELKYRMQSTKANVEVQEANLKQSELDIRRAENLLKKDAISKERYDKTKTGYEVSVAIVKSAQDQLNQAKASLETQKAVIRQLQASLQSQGAVVKQKEATFKAATLNQGYTKFYAPIDGYVTKKNIEVGNQIQPSQPLMAVVPLSDIYITANYKETQLEKVKPGQKVEIKVDTYPGKTFRGKIESIMAATGAAFSLFPPENATGNYVKVVQRIPVKIILDKGTDPEHVLRVGMSVVPTIILEK